MAKFDVIASPDFKNGGCFVFGKLVLEHKTETLPALFGTTTPKDYRYDLAKDVAAVEVQTEEGIRKLSGAVGWGVAGTLLLGPVGLLLGALWGGRRRELVCFSAKMKDGKQFLALADPSFYRQCLVSSENEKMFQQPPISPPQPPLFIPRPPQPPVSNRRFFCYLNNLVQGPFDLSTLASLRSQNQIEDETLCCLEGAEEWMSYDKINCES